MTESERNKRIPIREKLLSAPLTKLSDVRLLGSRCTDCGEVNLGEVSSCQNCAGDRLVTILLSDRGKLWTFTIIRNKPPGDFKGTVPMGEGLVELPEGIRIKSPIGGKMDALCIGMDLAFVARPLYVNERGQEVIAFQFEPI